MKNIGIWMDREKAYILSIDEGKESLISVFSTIEDFRIGGGSGSRLKGGPQDVVQDSTYLGREKNQFKIYFKEIIKHLKNARKIVIFGPAEAGEKFNKKLQKKHKIIGNKVDAVIKADSMTLNQIKALIRDYFKSERD